MVITLSAPDISCGSCVAHIRAALADLPVVVACTVDLRQKRIGVELAQESALPAVRQRLNDEGYPTTVVSP